MRGLAPQIMTNEKKQLQVLKKTILWEDLNA
jgi:hypothetical protein